MAAAVVLIAGLLALALHPSHRHGTDDASVLADVIMFEAAWRGGTLPSAGFVTSEEHELAAMAGLRDHAPGPALHARQLWTEWVRLTLDEVDVPEGAERDHLAVLRDQLSPFAQQLDPAMAQPSPISPSALPAPAVVGPSPAAVAGAILADDPAADGSLADELDRAAPYGPTGIGMHVSAVAARVAQASTSDHLEELVASAQRLLLVGIALWQPDARTGLDPRLLVGDGR